MYYSYNMVFSRGVKVHVSRTLSVQNVQFGP